MKIQDFSRVTNAMVRRSHEAQFNGADYQQISWEILQELKFEPTQDEMNELNSSPDPGCECGFCATADWQD